MSIGARIFVLFVFAVLGLSFIATTATLAWEFRDTQWLDFATTDSHLFIFFPTFAIVALVAFYLPASVFVDMYWRHVWFGKHRFVVGTVVIASVSFLIALSVLSSPKRSIWEIAPALLQADKGEPAGCPAQDGFCQRMPILQAVHNLREVSQSRLGLAEFIRDCTRDPLIEPSVSIEPKRFCFASTPLTNPPRLQLDSDCCRAQERFTDAVRASYQRPEGRSVTAWVHALLLPFKVFFLLVLLAISVLLAARHKGIEKHYGDLMERVELGVIVGTAATLMFPLMSHAFVQSTEALGGTGGRGTFAQMTTFISFMFGAWTLLILLFFYRRRDKEIEVLGKLAGVVASAVAVLKYNLIVSIFVRVLGSGASAYVVAGLVAISLLAVYVTLRPSPAVTKALREPSSRGSERS